MSCLKKGINDVPSSYQPIYLLSEADKLLEKVIAKRLVAFLDKTKEISELQFGIQKGNSSINAIEQARDLIMEVVDKEGVVIAVSLDVPNDFNFLPWRSILSALEKKEIPNYLKAIAKSYFEDRHLIYVDRLSRVKR